MDIFDYDPAPVANLPLALLQIPFDAADPQRAFEQRWASVPSGEHDPLARYLTETAVSAYRFVFTELSLDEPHISQLIDNAAALGMLDEACPGALYDSLMRAAADMGGLRDESYEVWLNRAYGPREATWAALGAIAAVSVWAAQRDIAEPMEVRDYVYTRTAP